MTGNGSPQTTDFAQVGVMEEQGQSGLWVFYDYASSFTYYAPVLVTAASSWTAYNFSGKYNTINKFYYLYWHTVSIGHACNLGWSSNRGLFNAEVRAQQDYILGTTSSVAKTYNEQYLQGGAWHYYGSSGDEPLSLDDNATYGAYYSHGWDYPKVYDTRS